MIFVEADEVLREGIEDLEGRVANRGKGWHAPHIDLHVQLLREA